MLLVIYAGIERGKQPRKSSPRGSNPSVAITVHRPDQGQGEGSAGVDPLEKVMLDGLEKFTYASSFLTDDKKEQLRLALLSNIDVFT